MKSNFRLFLYAAGLLALILPTACLDNKFEEYEAEEARKIKNYIDSKGFAEEDKLPSGIYLKFYENNTETDSVKLKTGNIIIVSYTGMLTDGKIFETTDAKKGASEFPKRYFVYGPMKLKVGYTQIWGFDTTIRFFSPGDSGTMVIPSKYAWYDYNPVVYHVKLHEVFKNDSTFEASTWSRFWSKNTFDSSRSFQYSEGLFYRFLSDTVDSLSSSPIPVKDNDSLIIDLTARYAESYYENGQGRIFFPLVGYPSQFRYAYGKAPIFPIVAAIDSAVKRMSVGDEIEICGTSKWGYGTKGFNDSYYNITAVPPSMPVHYKIKLIKHIPKNN